MWYLVLEYKFEFGVCYFDLLLSNFRHRQSSFSMEWIKAVYTKSNTALSTAPGWPFPLSIWGTIHTSIDFYFDGEMRPSGTPSSTSATHAVFSHSIVHVTWWLHLHPTLSSMVYASCPHMIVLGVNTCCCPVSLSIYVKGWLLRCCLISITTASTSAYSRHLFWECGKTKLFWKSIFSWLQACKIVSKEGNLQVDGCFGSKAR